MAFESLTERLQNVFKIYLSSKKKISRELMSRKQLKRSVLALLG